MSDTRTAPRLGPLSPPVFHDQHLSDTARLNYWMVAVVAVAVTAFIPLGYAFARSAMRELLPVIVAVLVNCLATLIVTRLGHPIAAARLLVTGTWVITTSLVLATGGVESPAL